MFKLLQELRETVTFDDRSGRLKTGYGLVLVTSEHRIDYDDFEQTRAFVDKHAFIGYIGSLYDDIAEDSNWHDFDLADLHVDDEIRDLVHSKSVPKLKGADCQKMNDLYRLEHWDRFCEIVWIIDKFK